MALQFRWSDAPAGGAEEQVSADWSTFTAIFREYAEYVFEYCTSLLSDEREAAGATTVTFITAQALLGYLEEHDRLEAWLYALARRECTSKHPARWEKLPEGAGGDGASAGTAQAQPADDGSGAAASPSARNDDRSDHRSDHRSDDRDDQGSDDRGDGRSDAQGRSAVDEDTDQMHAITRGSARRMAARQALSAFSRLPEEDREVLAAFSALSPRDREVLDLVYWHGLSAVELPAILDIPPQRAQTLLAAAARRFRDAAEDVQAAGEPGQEAEGSADKLAAAMPLARMPAAVWRRASRAAFDPELRAYRSAVVAHAGRLRPDGFPAQPAARAQTLKVSAAVLVPAAVGLALLVYLAGSSSGSPSGQLALAPDGHSAAGAHSPAGSGHGRATARHGALPVASLFPGHVTQGILPVPTPSPTGTNGFTPVPSTSAPAPSSSQPSSISQPPPSKSAKPTPSPSSASPTPTVSAPSPTPTSTGSTSPTATSTSSPQASTSTQASTSSDAPTSVAGAVPRFAPLGTIERLLT